MDFIKHVLVAAALFVAIDAVWLSVVANKFYKKHLGYILADKPNFVPAAIFYLLYMIGLVVFALDPALKQGSLNSAAGHGALLGLVMYATYDLTNHATLKGWPAKVTYVDMLWGTTVTAVVSTLGFVIFN